MHWNWRLGKSTVHQICTCLQCTMHTWKNCNPRDKKSDPSFLEARHECHRSLGSTLEWLEPNSDSQQMFGVRDWKRKLKFVRQLPNPRRLAWTCDTSRATTRMMARPRYIPVRTSVNEWTHIRCQNYYYYSRYYAKVTSTTSRCIMKPFDKMVAQHELLVYSY